jgi:hypothetical protein
VRGLDVEHELGEGLAGEGVYARDELVQYDAEAPHVGGRGVRLFGAKLGGQVQRGSDKRGHEVRFSRHFAHAKITELDCAAASEKYVEWLDVPVHHAVAVTVCERLEQGEEQAHEGVFVEQHAARRNAVLALLVSFGLQLQKVACDVWRVTWCAGYYSLYMRMQVAPVTKLQHHDTALRKHYRFEVCKREHNAS